MPLVPYDYTSDRNKVTTTVGCIIVCVLPSFKIKALSFGLGLRLVLTMKTSDRGEGLQIGSGDSPITQEECFLPGV